MSMKTPRGSQPPINLYDTDVGELYQIPINERWQEFSVQRPVKESEDYISYEMSGYDAEGQFCIRKRYSDFDQLRRVLCKRWPGFYIPTIPPKKTIVSIYTSWKMNDTLSLYEKLYPMSDSFLYKFCLYVYLFAGKYGLGCG